MKQKKKRGDCPHKRDRSVTNKTVSDFFAVQANSYSISKTRKNRLRSYTDNKAHKHAASTHQQNVDYKIEFLEVKHSVISLYVLPV